MLFLPTMSHKNTQEAVEKRFITLVAQTLLKIYGEKTLELLVKQNFDSDEVAVVDSKVEIKNRKEKEDLYHSFILIASRKIKQDLGMEMVEQVFNSLYNSLVNEYSEDEPGVRELQEMLDNYVLNPSRQLNNF